MILLVVRRLRIPEDLRHVNSLARAVCSSRRFHLKDGAGGSGDAR